jgi:3-isopropylmalate dehydrogenase
MMLRHGLDMETEADAIERAVDAALERGLRTPDLAVGDAETVGTEEMTEAVLEEIALASADS